MYTTNELLSHPLVSPVLQPTLGGLPPLLIMVGGAEVLCDEQIFLAHKCANPTKYAPTGNALSEESRLQLGRFPPTPVQLQVWDDLCHVAPTLSFTRPAKYMYRSVAQFSAWALARAQKTSILIPDDDDDSSSSSSSVISLSSSTTRDNAGSQDSAPDTAIGKAGYPLPPFKNHMIRQRVTRHGTIFPLDSEADLPGCTVKPRDVGVINTGPVRTWLETRERWDAKFSKHKRRVHERMAREMAEGYLAFGNGEVPPPSALAGRRRSPAAKAGWTTRKRKSVGLALWSLWGSAEDKVSNARETAMRKGEGLTGSRRDAPRARSGRPRGASYRGVMDENQIGDSQTGVGSSLPGTAKALAKEASDLSGTTVRDKETPVAFERRETLVEDLLRERKEKEEENNRLLGPEHAATGVAGRRPTVEGIAVPFSLGGGTAGSSMVTLNSEDVASLRSSGAGDSVRVASVEGGRSRGAESSLKGPEVDGERSSGVEERPGSTCLTAKEAAA